MNHVFIGRFQLPHEAHLRIVKEALGESLEERPDDRLLIIVGSKNAPPSPKNPWSFDDRVKMLELAILEAYGEPKNESWTDKPRPSILSRITFVGVRDYLYSDYKWVSEVQSVAERHFGSNKLTLHGCYKDDTSYYLDMFPHWGLSTIPYLWNLDASDLRHTYYEKGPLGLDGASHVPEAILPFLNEWHKGLGREVVAEYQYYQKYRASWSTAPFPPTFVTSDALVIKAGCVLLVKRKIHPGKGLWALPGGFVGQSESFQRASIRELKEETDISIPVTELEASIVSNRVFDHPHRSQRGRVITTAFLFDLGKSGSLPAVRGGDDAALAEWIPLADFFTMENQMFEDHWHMIYSMIANY